MSNIIANKKQLPFLDFMRIISAVFVFLFHSNIHLEIKYGFLNPFINESAIFMTAFFMLSGLSLAYNYGDKDLMKLANYFTFIKKRIVSIYPAYIIVYVLFVIMLICTHTMQLSTTQNLVVLPVELTLLQSVFADSFSTLHNGGTWFISCIFICYLMFPFFCTIIKQLNKSQLLFLSLFCYCILMWGPIVQHIMKYYSIYANPFFRLLEFVLGICVIQLINVYQFHQKNGASTCVVLAAILLIVVTLLRHFLNIKAYCLYNFIVVPIFFLMFYYGLNIENKTFDKILKTKICKYLSKISYVFFLAQFFTWDTYKFIKSETNFVFNSLIGFSLSFAICIIYTIIIYELMVKPLTKISKCYLLNTNNQ